MIDPTTLRGLARPLGATNRALAKVTNQLTPGQRWTSALSLVLAAALLAFGTPIRIVERTSAPTAPAADGASASGRAAPAAEQASSSPASSGVAPTGPTPEAPSPAAEAVASPGPSTAKLVALVRTGDGAVPGRDDAAIAKAFLDGSGLSVTTVDLGTEPPPCNELTAAGDVFMAGGTVPAAVRDCLVGAGKTVVAFDANGDAPPATGGGQVVSTRRGAEHSLLDLAEWAGRSGALRGKVGIVVHRSLAEMVERLLPRFRALGIDVAETVVLDDSASSEVTAGVRSFATEGIDAVLLTVPMELQRRWVAHAAVLLPGVRHVVADTFDAVVDEMYPVTFNGALAHTSMRVPWFARDHGETTEQERCRTAWESSAGAPRNLGTSELVRVFSWCQTVALVANAVAAASGARTVEDALRRQRVPSPLTADLGPLEGGGYGPTADAVLTWQADCRCWTERQPFAPRKR